MKKLLWGLLCASFVGPAVAGELNYATDSQYSNDHVARLFYKVNFGGTRAGAHAVGLRFDTARMEARGAPALLETRFDKSGAVMSLSGVELRGSAASAGANGSNGTFASLNTAQWIGIAVVGVTFGVIVTKVSSGDDPSSGTGGY